MLRVVVVFENGDPSSNLSLYIYIYIYREREREKALSTIHFGRYLDPDTKKNNKDPWKNKIKNK